MDKNSIAQTEVINYQKAILNLIRSGCEGEELREKLEDYHDYDIAEAVKELTKDERDSLLRVIGAEKAADILAYLTDAGEYLREVELDTIADMIESMDADDAKDVLDELSEDVRSEVMELIEDEGIKEDIELLTSYSPDVFGGRMSTNYISIKSSLDIKGAMRALVAMAAENDNIQKIFVTDEAGVFCGAIDLAELIIARSSNSLDELIHPAFPFVYDTEEIDESIERVRAYEEPLIPVLREDGILVGVITSNDIAELVDESIADDYAKLAALGTEEESGEKLAKSLGKRLPWLIILLFLGLVVSAVVGIFEGVVAELPMIVAFQSLILGMAGNVGTQSLAVTVRSLVGGERLGILDRLGIVFKETRVALLLGAVMGLVSTAIVWGYLALSGYDAIFSLSVGGCVGGAMCFAMMISGMTGAAIPLALHQAGVDPAVASGPLITTINDLVAVVSYYGLAWATLSLIL